jgi:penicillin-binding protein 2
MQAEVYQSRRRILEVVFLIAFLALVFKCCQLQVLDKSYQQQHSYRQVIVEYPSRGLIYDRNGKLLVYNKPLYDLMVTYDRVRKSNLDTARFCNLLGIDTATFRQSMYRDFKDKRFSPLKPYEFRTRIPADTFARFEEHLYEFPGFESMRRHIRGYSISHAAHLLGYISEVSPEQIEANGQDYRSGDFIGTSGLELAYEKELKGKTGVKNVLKDKWGRIQGAFRNGAMDIPASSGLDLISTIDMELQAYAEALMQNKRGALVAIEPSTGEILAFVSVPTYDPKLLAVDGNRKEYYQSLQMDSLKPLFNRALMAKYPPGSIFKTVLSAIGLQEGVLTPDRGMPCGGAFHYGNLRVGCHGHGAIVSVPAAIQYSCNSYFCNTFKELVNLYGYDFPEKGLDKLVDHLQAFGLGRKMGVDIPNEVEGRVPSSEYYNRKYGKGRWRFSNCVSLGIGQGELEITPLQMANITAIIANRGFYYIPHFARELKGDSTNRLQKYRQRQYTKVHPRHFESVVDGMELVVLAGTAQRARIPGIVMCGKTGTVQNPHGKDHSTFIAFAPKENPKIAIAVFVENSGFGSMYAAPIASLTIEKYINGKIDESRLPLEKSMMNANLLYNYPVWNPSAVVIPAPVVQPDGTTVIEAPREETVE